MTNAQILRLASTGWQYIDTDTWVQHHDRHGWLVLRRKGAMYHAAILPAAPLDGLPVEIAGGFAGTPSVALLDLGAQIERHASPRAMMLGAWAERVAAEASP